MSKIANPLPHREPPFDKDSSVFTNPRLSTVSSTAKSASNIPSHVFNAVNAPQQQFNLIFPAAYIDQKEKKLVPVDASNTDSLKTFVSQDLSVASLNLIHRHLWLVGLPVCSRSLHHQLLYNRVIVLTERADLHLVWQGSTMYLKPLPEYLMDWSTWNNIICKSQCLFEDANGLLLSYMWLICSQSDLKIAHDAGLVSEKLDWECWTSFSRKVLLKIQHEKLIDVNPRYLYGELRMARINLIYRFCTATTSFSTFIRGYQYGYRQYNTFLERNFAWLLTAIIYITVVLTAMQLGLGTDQLRDNASFNRVSYGFAIFAIIAPLAVLLIAAGIVIVLVFFNLLFAIGKRREAQTMYKQLFESTALDGLHVRGSRRKTGVANV